MSAAGSAGATGVQSLHPYVKDTHGDSCTTCGGGEGRGRCEFHYGRSACKHHLRCRTVRDELFQAIAWMRTPNN
eukprot:6277294-Amphidinium_carterae.1